MVGYEKKRGNGKRTERWKGRGHRLASFWCLTSELKYFGVIRDLPFIATVSVDSVIFTSLYQRCYPYCLHYECPASFISFKTPILKRLSY